MKAYSLKVDSYVVYQHKLMLTSRGYNTEYFKEKHTMYSSNLLT